MTRATTVTVLAVVLVVGGAVVVNPESKGIASVLAADEASAAQVGAVRRGGQDRLGQPVDPVAAQLCRGGNGHGCHVRVLDRRHLGRQGFGGDGQLLAQLPVVVPVQVLVVAEEPSQ